MTIKQELLTRLNRLMVKNASGLVGKTIVKTHEAGGVLYLLFHDGTFCEVEANSSDCLDYVSIATQAYSPDHEYKSLGLITQKEYSAFLEEDEELIKRQAHENNRQQYLRLKQIFEPNGETGNV